MTQQATANALWTRHRHTDSKTEDEANAQTLKCIDPRLERDSDVIDSVCDIAKISVTEALKR